MIRPRVRVVSQMLFIFAAFAPPALAQTSPTPAGGSARQPQALLPLPSAGSGGSPAGTTPAFVIESDDGDNRMQIGAMLNIDGRFTPNDQRQEVIDSFTLRRFRATTQGRVARHFEFFLNTEFAGTLSIRDGYIDTVWSPSFRVRVGKARVPFSYDRNLLVLNLPFIERGLTTAVAPDRDTGVVVMSDLAEGAVSLFGSITNGVVDGGLSDGDTNDGKDFAGRVVARPWFSNAAHPLRDLGMALAGNRGAQGPALPSFLTAGRQTFFAYAPGATGAGTRIRWSPQAFYYRGRFGGYGEFVRSRGSVERAGETVEIDHDAWQIAATWVLSGESVSPERNVRPRASFDPATGHYGAMQLAVRLQRLAVSEAAITRGLAAAGASRRADVLTIGLNWYANPYIKWMLSADRTVFDGSTKAARAPEHTLAVRAQLGF